MCHSRHTSKLSRFAALPAPQLPDQLIREITDIAEPSSQDTGRTQDIALLQSANTPNLPIERVFHLDGSEDTTTSIDFLQDNAYVSRIVDLPLEGSDFESQFAVYSIVLLRHRIWLNGGREPGSDEDFRIISIRGRGGGEDGRYLARLDNPPTTPGDNSGIPFLDRSSDNTLPPPDLTIQLAHLEFEGVYAPVVFTHHQRSAIADHRLHAIATRINIFRGHPYELTRLPMQFMASLDDIESLFNQICEMRQELEEETLNIFDRALDQIERTASLVVLHQRLRIATGALQG